MENKIRKILDKAYAFVVAELAKEGIKADSQGADDCIWVDDDEQKKTFCIHIDMMECEEYAGE